MSNNVAITADLRPLQPVVAAWAKLRIAELVN